MPVDPAEPVDVDALRFDEAGLVAAIVTQHDSGEVLMLAWMNREAVAATLESGETVFWSRSRQELWHKGATSGNRQRVVDIAADCDGDALLISVDQIGDGAACHTGRRSCFYRPMGRPAIDPILPSASERQDMGNDTTSGPAVSAQASASVTADAAKDLA